jgi:predicted phosphodiesterase
MIGIMADSHGHPETILAALAMFKNLSCRRIYHLGDVCDSTRPQTAEACLGPLQEHRVITIKGNNDHTLVANHLGRKEAPIAPKILQYIQNLPLVQHYHDAVLTHSLPFADTLGLACMIGTMSEKQAQRAFNDFPHHIIFRGHSHMPEILQPRGRRIEASNPAVGVKIDLGGRLPCVVTCGALTRGLFMTWDPDENYIESHSFKFR